MRKLFSFICCFCLVSVGLAQTAAWDSTFRPGKYQHQVEQFRLQPDAASDIIFLGNSITAGTNWPELLKRNDVHNRGISGDITFGILERLDEITSGAPAKVFLLIGINDISRDIPDEVIINNFHRIVQRIKTESPKTKIYLQTILPVNSEFGKKLRHYNKDEHIDVVNTALKKLAAWEKLVLIDLNSGFKDDSGKLKKEFTYDGLHLNAEGYQHWALMLQQGKYLDK